MYAWWTLRYTAGATKRRENVCSWEVILTRWSRFSHARVRSTYVGVIESSVIEKELSSCASKASCNPV